MPITYENFRGETYFLHSKKTKKGNTTYFFSKKSEGAADINDIPEGYEIYEEPNGKVYLRKKLKKLIRDDEIRIIKAGMEQHCEIKDFKIDMKKDIVYIYTVMDSFANLESTFMPFNVAALDKYKSYQTELRFILVDKDERFFEVERTSYLGTEEEWMFLDGSDDLEGLVKEYVQHLGKESFFDLM
ncbi:hypothetical protein [Aquibacillus albus]|uniref:DUF3885 domain-containing protein n=1 Tax=Aquibacillus albus TaxID=1168171 RepID=A0ABS2N6Q5_9BACI|nr:hypothetical protein [Aquibacillus albus]MBM7573570.1 hypothetical protein [Aquibacillus albus]